MNLILKELKEHSPFTWFGTLTGVALMALIAIFNVPRSVSENIFWVLHPAHVLMSAWVTASLYYIYGKKNIIYVLIVGYLGSVGIGTLSDCIIPYFGELLLNMPHAHHHIGFIEKWWLINPLAIVGILLALKFSITKEPHALHVLLSTWASLFHIIMAMGISFNAIELVLIALFLFLAVWLPCCVSDIVFPLLVVKKSLDN